MYLILINLITKISLLIYNVFEIIDDALIDLNIDFNTFKKLSQSEIKKDKI